LYRAVSINLLDGVQDFRHHINGLKVAQDMRVDLTMRRAAGLFELHQAAILKESTVTLNPVATAAGVGESAFSLLHRQSTAKGKDRPAVSAVVARVRDEANRELERLTNGPEVKWTWGVNLSNSDVERMANPDPNPDMHSGYLNSLRQGRLAPGSVTTEWQDARGEWDFEAPEVPPLAEENWPLNFTEPPL